MNYYDRRDPEMILSSVFALYRSKIDQLLNSNFNDAASMLHNFYCLLKATISLETALLPNSRHPSMRKNDPVQLCSEFLNDAALYLPGTFPLTKPCFESSVQSYNILCSKDCIERILLNMICGAVSVLSYRQGLNFKLEPLSESSVISVCDKTRLKTADTVNFFSYWSDGTSITPIGEANDNTSEYGFIRVAQPDTGGMAVDPVLWLAPAPDSYDEYDPSFDVDDESDFASQRFADEIRSLQNTPSDLSSQETIATVQFDLEPEFDISFVDIITDDTDDISDTPTFTVPSDDVYSNSMFLHTYGNSGIAFSVCAALACQCDGQFSVICSETYGSYITLTLPNQPFGLSERIDVLPTPPHSSGSGNFDLFLTELSDILPDESYSQDTI